MTRLILASKSKARASLLQGAGIDFAIVPSHVDEDALKLSLRSERATVSRQVECLAEAKALRVSTSQPGLVLGADQMMSFRNQAFDKPQSLEDAAKRLKTLRGATHHLENAMVIAEDGRPVWRHVSRCALKMRNFSDEFVDHYLEAAGEDVLASVGAYQLEGVGVQLFDRIEGDYFSILGLPLLPLLDYLRTRGLLRT